MDVLRWLGATPFGVWARESESIWAYPTILFLHTLGLGFLVGFATVIDFRVLGFAARVPLAAMDRFFLVIWAGFWINAVSGAALLVITPAKAANPVFFVKMTCIVLGVVTMVVMRRSVVRAADETTSQPSMPGSLLAVSSLVLWAAAIVAGRLMAYIGNVR